MSYITKYGSFWGLIPQTNGQVFWVAASDSYVIEGRTFSSSNDNDGLSPERAKRTLAGAISAATASVNDVIVLLPGAHSWTASAALSKAGLTVTGLPGGKGHPMKQRTSVTTTAADQIMNVTAANVEVAYLHFIPVTAQAALDYSSAADYLYIHDCTVDMISQVESTATIGFQSVATASGVTNLRLENLYFESIGGTGPYLDLNDTVSGDVVGATFRHTGSTALADGVVSATGAVDIVMDSCRWIAGTSAVMTDAIDWTANTLDSSLQLINCTFSYGSGNINASADLDVVVDDLRSVVMLTAAGGSGAVNVINAT